MTDRAAAIGPERPEVMALARLFAAWWERQERALAYDTGISIGFDEICKSGLFDSHGGWSLTDAGRAAIALVGKGETK